jgi:hypothetical protein
VSHGIGLFDKVNTFRVRYLLSRQWTVQAETGRGTGADVLYRLERGESGLSQAWPVPSTHPRPRTADKSYVTTRMSPRAPKAPEH